MTVLRYTWHLSEASHVERVTGAWEGNMPERALRVAADEDLVLGRVMLLPMQARVRISVTEPSRWAGEYEIEVATWRPVVAVKRAKGNKEEPRHD